MEQHIFDYHRDLADYFKSKTKTWEWFSKKQVQDEHIASYKKELLKNTYRLSPDSEKNIYDLVNKAKTSLGISKKVIVFQELESYQVNAQVIDLENEINIVISGNLLSLLSEKELLAILAHELTHVVFFKLNNGDFEITSRIINAIANDGRSSGVMVETARLYQLYKELFCDRGSIKVLNEMDTVVETFVKVSTGLKTVSAKNYLKQAREIFSEDNEGTHQTTHPETFIRARALEIYHQKEDEKIIPKMIDSRWSMEKLDLFKQKELYKTTEKILKIITKPKWIQNENVMALCQQYYPKFNFSKEYLIDKELESFFENVDDSVKEYFSYVLLDFCYVDSALQNAPLGHVFQIAEALSFHKIFRQILKKETKLTVKKLDQFISKAVTEVSQLSESEDESILTDQ